MLENQPNNNETSEFEANKPSQSVLFYACANNSSTTLDNLATLPQNRRRR